MTTIKDIAAATNVSLSTVSAVLGGKGEKLGLRPETCRKVLLAAAKLRYRKNTVAAQMKSGRGNTLALILPAQARGFVFRAAASAGIEAEKHRFFIKLVTAAGRPDFRERLDELLGQCPAAILHWGTAGTDENYLIEVAKECNIPLIFLDYTSEDHTLYTVRTDDRSGIFQGVRHLAKLGHRRIGHLTAPLDQQFAAERLLAFQEAMSEQHLSICDDHIFCGYDETDPTPMQHYLTGLIESKNRPTALVCGADYIATEALTLLLGLGIRVPSELSLLGYGNLSTGRYCVPRLSTIDQPLGEIGTVGASLAAELIEKGEAPHKIVLPTTLLLRGTTAAPFPESESEKRNSR